MSEQSDFRHWGASEFPNDNPLLHDGAIWVCFAPCGPLRPVVRPRPGVRSSTIPTPPLDQVSHVERLGARVPELIRPPAIEALPTPETLATAVPVASVPSLELEAPPTVVAEGPLEEPSALDAAGDPPSSGCSLSAGLAPDEAPGSDRRVSEMRERPREGAPEAENDDSAASPTASAAAQCAAKPGLDDRDDEAVRAVRAPVEVECSPEPSEDKTIALAAVEASAERMTILPPPSEDETRTLTLTRIHVSGRSSSVGSDTTPPAEQRLTDSPAAVEASAVTAESSLQEQDPFAAFVAALVSVALAGGATRAAAVLPGLLDGNAGDLSGFPDAVRSSIVSAAIVSDGAGTLAPSASFTATSNAWRMVLRGESNDFSACGTSTLDGWAADLLKAFGVGRDGRVDVRRELRRRGVAAFGMILAA